MIRTYSEMMKFDSFEERLKYLQLFNEKHTSPRSISTDFYKSPAWEAVRKEVIQRDGSWDLGVFGVYVNSDIYVHHINPLDPDDIINFNEDKLLNPENLITVSHATHMLIHYGKQEVVILEERRAGDTKLW